ncbi:MAG: nucleoside monophosphate kinase [Patescibacteria group bacterium]
MNTKNAVIIYGNTCAGKSTLGKKIEKEMKIKYISFGDLKRLEIINKSSIGIILDSQIKNGKPINPLVGARLIEKYLGLLNIISGYPISIEELRIFRARCRCIIQGIIHLGINEIKIRQRFFNRGICQNCGYIGQLQKHCRIDDVLLVKRFDCNEDELNFRLQFYKNRILPFIQGASLSAYPMINIDTSDLSEEEIFQKAKEFLESLKIKQ